MATNIVTDWLRFLDLEEYSTGFLENGYDDMETVKQISLADLLAIGVVRTDHQEYLLSSVRILREQGAAWVYLVVSEQNNPSLEVTADLQSDATPRIIPSLNSCPLLQLFLFLTFDTIGIIPILNSCPLLQLFIPNLVPCYNYSYS